MPNALVTFKCAPNCIMNPQDVTVEVLCHVYDILHVFEITTAENSIGAKPGTCTGTCLMFKFKGGISWNSMKFSMKFTERFSPGNPLIKRCRKNNNKLTTTFNHKHLQSDEKSTLYATAISISLNRLLPIE
jgi:hypothetical protein